jgi:hypothetical protein
MKFRQDCKIKKDKFAFPACGRIKKKSSSPGKILLILSEKILDLCINNYELIGMSGI